MGTVADARIFDPAGNAYRAAAVPETLDGACVVFEDKRMDLVAEMMGRLVSDGALRQAVIRGQRERLARYRDLDQASGLREALGLTG